MNNVTGGTEQICVDCNGWFHMSLGELDWFAERGMEQPRRCRECRAKRKAQREKEANDARS